MGEQCLKELRVRLESLHDPDGVTLERADGVDPASGGCHQHESVLVQDDDCLGAGGHRHVGAHDSEIGQSLLDRAGAVRLALGRDDFEPNSLVFSRQILRCNGDQPRILAARWADRNAKRRRRGHIAPADDGPAGD